MKRLFALLPDGQIVSRKTHRKYTHVIAAEIEGKWCAVRWTATWAQAVREETRKWSTVKVCPVTDH